jgi:hypothetical protein
MHKWKRKKQANKETVTKEREDNKTGRLERTKKQNEDNKNKEGKDLKT